MNGQHHRGITAVHTRVFDMLSDGPVDQLAVLSHSIELHSRVRVSIVQQINEPSYILFGARNKLGDDHRVLGIYVGSQS